jgi:N-acetylglutamate synthase-like GNAT family acetyltransferase
MRHQDCAILGSAGVIPKHRGSSLIYNLAANVLLQARDEGVDTVLLQTTLGPIFERFLRIIGFKLAFKRTGYVLA